MNMINDVNVKGVVVNCGKLVSVSGMAVEILSPSISSHGDNIVNAYFMDNGVKIELSYWGTDNFTVYKFKGKFESQHYWSKNYNVGNAPQKYKGYIDKLIAVFDFLSQNKKFEEAI